MNRCEIRSIVLLGIITLYAIGCSNPPAPYTEKAAADLTKAMNKVEQPVPKSGATKIDNIKLIVNYLRTIYSTAGYDFDKSLVQLNDDLSKDPEYLSKLPLSGIQVASIMVQWVDILNNAFEQAQANPKDYLSNEAAKAILEFGDRQMAQKAQEEKKKEEERKVQEASKLEFKKKLDNKNEINSLFEEILRKSHGEKNIDLYLSCYSMMYPELALLKDKAIKRWGKFEGFGISFSNMKIDILDDNNAIVNTLVNYAYLPPNSTWDYKEVNYKIFLIKENSRWKIKNIKSSGPMEENSFFSFL